MYNLITPPEKNKEVIQEVAHLFGLALNCILSKVEINEEVKWALHYIDNALNWVNRAVSGANLIDPANKDNQEVENKE